MRKSCPDEEMLADYLEDRLSDDERLEMEEHLSACDDCLDELVVAERFNRCEKEYESDSVPSRTTQAAVHLITGHDEAACVSLGERFKEYVKEISSKIADMFPVFPAGQLEPVPIRGEKQVISQDLVRLKKTFKEIETEIEIEKVKKQKALIRVQLSGSSKREKKVRVTLKKGEREISSQLIEGGYVLFEDIPFGHYNLIFARDGVMLGKYLFEIKES